MTRLLPFLFVACFLLVACAPPEGGIPPGDERLPATATPLPVETLFPSGAMAALDHPESVPATEATGLLAPQEEVMGLTVGGESRAYPLGLLSRHELANDTLGGEPIAITFCPLCNSGIAFSRTVTDSTGTARILTFGVSGKVVDNAMILVDHETGSLWAQSRGRAIEGSLQGTALPLLAASQVSWEEWVRQHPDTTVAHPQRPPAPSTTFVPPAIGNSRDAPVEPAAGYVLGIASPVEARAFPLAEIERVGVVNGEVEGAAPFLLVALGAPGEIAAWQRTHEGRTLSFEQAGDVLRDTQTGSEWDARTGQAVSGPLAGTALEPVDVRLTHLRGWLDLYPESDLWAG